MFSYMSYLMTYVPKHLCITMKLDGLVLDVISTFSEAALSSLIFQRSLPNQTDMLLEKSTKPSLKCLKIDKREKLMKMKKNTLQEPDRRHCI